MNSDVASSSVLLLDKIKSNRNGSSSSILSMIFFTVMLSLTNYLSRQFSYFMEDIDLKKILNYELILHNFYKKNSVIYEGKISNSHQMYVGELMQSCIFSDRFKALWEHFSKNTNAASIHALKEYTLEKSDDAVYLVNQKEKFLLSEEHEIYAYTRTFKEEPPEPIDEEILNKIPDRTFSPAEIINIYMAEERSSTKFLSHLINRQ